MNIAGKVFDRQDDNLKIASIYKDQLKGVRISDSKDLDNLSDDKFALIIKTADRKIRRMPIHTDDETKLSRCYFDHLKDEIHPTLRKVAEAGFEGGNNEIEIEKISNPVMTGISWRKYPLNTPEHIKTAMERFPYTTQRMEPASKCAYARAIIKEAGVNNISVGGEVMNYASEEINPVSVKIATNIRRAHVFDRKDLDLLEKVASKPSPERFVEFDKLAGLTQYVKDKKIPDGYASCHSLIKSAEVSDDERIKNIPLEKIEQLFDPQFAKEWATDPVTIYKSLPAPTQALIEKQASVAIPAALAALAGAAAGYVTGEQMAAGKAIDAQFQAKGWAKPKDKSEGFYVKDEQKVVQKNGDFCVIDKDGREVLKTNSLPKLVLMV